MKSITAADISATTPAQLAALRAGPPEAYAAWIQAAADLGLLEAQAILGQMLLDGHGMARDPEAALGWFKRAAQADHLMSINMVGRCYENGWGVARDETVAAYWFRLAADRGLDWGMYNYAHMLRDGRGGVAQDPAAALALYQRAAQSGHVKSIGVVGRFHEAGTVVPRDLEQAFDCYRRAAEGGISGACSIWVGCCCNAASATRPRLGWTACSDRHGGFPARSGRHVAGNGRCGALRRARRQGRVVRFRPATLRGTRSVSRGRTRAVTPLASCLPRRRCACLQRSGAEPRSRTASSTTRAPGPRSPASRSSSSRPARRPSSAALAVSVLRPGAHCRAAVLRHAQHRDILRHMQIAVVGFDTAPAASRSELANTASNRVLVARSRRKAIRPSFGWQASGWMISAASSRPSDRAVSMKPCRRSRSQGVSALTQATRA